MAIILVAVFVLRFASASNKEDNIEPIAEATQNKANNIGLNRLNNSEKILLCVWELEAEINNGGFEQYYFNSRGNNALFAPTALREIGAGHTAKIVDQANQKFGSAGPSGNREKRQTQLETIDAKDKKAFDDYDKSFLAYRDDISELLKQFTAKRKHDFNTAP